MLSTRLGPYFGNKGFVATFEIMVKWVWEFRFCTDSESSRPLRCATEVHRLPRPLVIFFTLNMYPIIVPLKYFIKIPNENKRYSDDQQSGNTDTKGKAKAEALQLIKYPPYGVHNSAYDLIRSQRCTWAW